MVDDTTKQSRTTKRFGSKRRNFLKLAGTGVAASSLTTVSGCLSGGGGGGGPIKVGHLAPLQHDMGKGSMRSARIAVEEINANGGIMDRDVELVEGDTQFSASQTNQLVQEMVQQKDVKFLSGTFASEIMLGIMERVASLGVPFISTGSASEKMTQNHVGKNYEKYKNYFRNNPLNSVYQGKSLGYYAKFLSDQHGWNSFAVVTEDAEWTKAFNEYTPQVIRDLGMEVTMNKRISPDTSDFTPILDSVEESGADVMMKAISHIPGTGMLSTWGANEYPFAQEGINVAGMSPQYYKDTNGNCTYETTSTSGGGGFGPAPSQAGVEFGKKYNDRYDTRPTMPMYMGMGTYDAMYIYKQAVESAGTVNYKKNLDDIVNALENLSFTSGVGAKTLEFFPKGHKYAHDVKPYSRVRGAGDSLTDWAPFPMVQWREESQNPPDFLEKGAKEVVWPKPFATADHVPPAWMA